jgi:hypothetical protein
MYYNKLLEQLSIVNTFDSRLATMINPFSPYYLCNHFYIDGNPLINPGMIGKNMIRPNTDISFIKEYDIINVEVNFFASFVSNILDKLDTKIILITGQFCNPQIVKSDLTDKVLHHKNILLWISQNPIYENSDRYMAFPYGMKYQNLETYSKMLFAHSNLKTKEILHLPLSNNTNICRLKLPLLSTINLTDFYRQIADAKFILSPIGDRDDCFRHYEAIGLGAIPISNVNPLYKNIFGSNMHYTDIDDMVNILEKNAIGCEYSEPNRDLICFAYYRDLVLSKINSIKASIIRREASS